MHSASIEEPKTEVLPTTMFSNDAMSVDCTRRVDKQKVLFFQAIFARGGARNLYDADRNDGWCYVHHSYREC
jgi:hypothetical protein